jgi:hypothetical protein
MKRVVIDDPRHLPIVLGTVWQGMVLPIIRRSRY